MKYVYRPHHTGAMWTYLGSRHNQEYRTTTTFDSSGQAELKQFDVLFRAWAVPWEWPARLISVVHRVAQPRPLAPGERVREWRLRWSMPTPFSGIRVAEFAQFDMVPYCA